MATVTARQLIEQAATEERYEGEFRDSCGLAGCYYNHVPEIDQYDIDFEKNTRIECRPIGYKNYDGRRYWQLACVFLDGQPVMLTQNAGREGDDHAQRFIVDYDRYGDMVHYMMTLYKSPKLADLSDVIDPDEKREDLDSFYGDDLQHVRAHPGNGWCC